jgi:hypothetical protein
VQGIDYAYTLQGWLKSINSGLLDSTLDMGNDGLVTTPVNQFAKDAIGFTLGYYYLDYASISGSPVEIDYSTTRPQMWNQNLLKNYI